jgi:hypothetical protein
MTLILSGTDGLSDVDGSAATPAIRGTDANTGIFFPAADTIAFSEGGVESMRIDSSGNVGIALTPTASVGALQVTGNIFATSTHYVGAAGSTAFSGGIQNLSNTSKSVSIEADPTNAGANSLMYFNVDGTTRMAIDSSGNLLVGTTSSPIANARFRATKGTGDWSFGPHSGGSEFLIYNTNSNGVYLTNGGTSWTGNSDERIKDIIEPISNAVEKVCTLRAVIGKYKTDADGIRRSFLIAQDVQAVLPEAVSVREDELGTLGVQYTDTIPLLVAAIKEQQAIITQQAAALTALTTRITALETPTGTQA